MNISKEQTIKPHDKVNLEHKCGTSIKIMCLLSPNTSRLVILLTEMKTISRDCEEVDFDHLEYDIRVGTCCALNCVSQKDMLRF